MPIERNRATARLLAATALALVPAALTPATLAQVAGTDRGITSAQEAAGEGVGAELARAQSLVDTGRLVHARAVLVKALSSPAIKTSPAKDRDGVLSLLKTVETRLNMSDPLEVSLQKADMALSEGDFILAERHAQGVLSKGTADAEQRAGAQTILTALQQRRGELAPLARNAIEQIRDDFKAGRYAQAKGALDIVGRTGVTLSEEDTRLLERYRMQIVDMEVAQQRIFPTDDVGLAVFQPGVVRRDRPAGETPAPAPAPAPEPAPAPAAENPSVTPGNGPAPAPIPAYAQPDPTPAPAPAPAAEPQPPQPTQDDVIFRALRADAQQIMAEADKLFGERRFNVAQDKYQFVLAAYRQYLQPEEITHAESRMAEARIQMNEGNPSDTIVGDITLIRDETRVVFANAMAQAAAALQAGDVGRAREMVASARFAYSKAKQHFNPAEQNDEFIKPINDLNRQIESQEESIRQEALKRQTADIASQQQRQETEAARLRSNKINEAIDRARALQQEQNYAEALQVVEQILFLDKQNSTALLLRDTLNDILIYQRYWDIQRRKAINGAKQALDAEDDMVPPGGIVDYPSDWPARSFGRGDYGAFADTAENRKTLAALEQKMPVTFRDNSVADVLKFVTSLTGVPIDPEWDSLRNVGVTEDTTVSFNISTQLPARVVLDRILAKVSTDALSKAGWAVTNGVVRVASQEDLNKDRTLVIYDIQDLLFDIPDYLDVPAIDLQSLLRQAQQGGGGGGQSPFTTDQQRRQGRDPNRPTREDRLQLIRQIIVQTVDLEGWADNGGETGTIQELNGSLIINNTPKNHREIVGLLSKLRQIRSMQINVETKFLLVNQSWFEQIGFDVDLVLNANNNQVRAARATDPTVQPGDFFNFDGSGGGRRGLQRNVSGGGTTPTSQAVGNPRSWSPVGIFSDSLGLASGLVEGDFATSVSQAAPALGISGQFLDDIQVDFLITATQADKRTVQLTAPRLTFTNGQTANIFVVTQQAFVSDLQPVVGDSAVGFDPTVSVASEGVTMLLEGVISSDRRYVTLNVDAGVGRIDGFAQQAVTAVAGGQLVNSADTQSFIQLPTITVTRVRTSVTVPDEGTVLLGGQRLITELEIETGVPVLSKIPIINRFFTNRIESKEEQTLLILVKPTVLIQAEQEEKHFPGLADRLQTGLR